MTTEFIGISNEDLQYIQNVVDSGVDLFRGYDRVLTYLEDDADRAYWFEGATIINRKANGVPLSPSNDLASTYIFTHSSYGLAMDGITKDVTATSNAIAEAVLLDILEKRGVPQIDEMLNDDIERALDFGGQSIGGWGGAFYYWSNEVNIGDSGATATVGEQILADGKELEKFYLSSTMAVIGVIKQETNQSVAPEEVLQVVSTGLLAGLPTNLKLVLVERIISALANGRLISDAEEIDGWQYDPAADHFISRNGDNAEIAIGAQDALLRSQLAVRVEIEMSQINELEDIFANSNIVFETHEYNVIQGSTDLFSYLLGDQITGTSENDAIFGYRGSDTITAGDGDDFVRASAGDDNIFGESGADEIYGDGGDDVLIGGSEIVFLTDEDGNANRNTEGDKLFGGSDQDILITGSVSADLNSSDPEQLQNSMTDFHNDQAFGGDGDDVFYSSGGIDLLVGGDGEDEFYILGQDPNPDLPGPIGPGGPLLPAPTSDVRGTFIFGGDGADQYHFYGNVDVAVVYIDGLTSSDWPDVDLEAMGSYFRTEYGVIADYFIVNPEAEDSLFQNGIQITAGDISQQVLETSIATVDRSFAPSNSYVDEGVLYREYDIETLTLDETETILYDINAGQSDEYNVNLISAPTSPMGTVNSLGLQRDVFDGVDEYLLKFNLSGFSNGLFGISFSLDPVETFKRIETIYDVTNHTDVKRYAEFDSDIDDAINRFEIFGDSFLDNLGIDPPCPSSNNLAQGHFD